MDLKSKGMEMMIRTVISALGIDAESLLQNISQFQQWVTHAVQHHDKRLAALESSNLELHAKLLRALEILEALDAANGHHYPAIAGTDGESINTILINGEH
jgi:hypothetical protein